MCRHREVAEFGPASQVSASDICVHARTVERSNRSAEPSRQVRCSDLSGLITTNRGKPTRQNLRSLALHKLCGATKRFTDDGCQTQRSLLYNTISTYSGRCQLLVPYSNKMWPQYSCQDDGIRTSLKVTACRRPVMLSSSNGSSGELWQS